MDPWRKDVFGETRDERAMVLLRCIVFAGSLLIVLHLGARAAGLADPWRSLVAVAISIPLGVAMHVGIALSGRAAGGAMARMTGLSGHGSRHGGEQSQLQALVAQGRVAEAVEGYERLVAADPRDAWIRLQAADVHARAAGDAARAAALFREARELLLARKTGRDDRWRESVLYATQRLVDLYDGPLGQEGRATVELRRLVELFPGTREAEGARAALARRRQARGEQA